MKFFLLRFFLFICLWVLMIHDAKEQLIFSLFMLTISLTIFFFLSNTHVSIYLYGILIIVLFIHAIYIGESVYTSLLLLLVVLIASFRFIKKMDTYAIVCITFFLFIFFSNSQNGELKLMSIICSIIIILNNTINNLKTKQKNNDIFMGDLNGG